MNWRNIVVAAVSVLTSKGQTTIPKEIREAARLSPGSSMTWVTKENGRIELIPRTLTMEGTFGMLDDLQAPVDPAPSIEELNEATADAAASHALGDRDYHD